MKNMNGLAALNDLKRQAYDFSEFLRWISIVLCCNLFEITVETALEKLSLYDCYVRSKKRM